MKKMFAVAAVLVVAAMMFAGCGSSDSGGGTTAVTTPAQGAQTAKVGATAATNAVNGVLGLSSTIGNPPMVGAFGKKASKKSQAMQKNIARLMPKLKKAKAIAMSANFAPTDVSTSACVDGGTASYDYNAASGIFSLTYSNCKNGGCTETGSMNFSISGTTLIATDSNNWTCYQQDINTTANDYTTAASTGASNQTVSLTNATATTFTMSLNGSDSYNDLLANSLGDKWKYQSVTAISVSAENKTASTTFDYVMTVNGSSNWSEWKNGTLNNQYDESFGNLKAEFSWDTNTLVEKYYIDGTYTLGLYPDDCAEGTYTFKTITPLTYDGNTGLLTAGEMTVNTVVVLRVNATTNDLEVSIDSGATFTSYTSAEFAALCPNL